MSGPALYGDLRTWALVAADSMVLLAQLPTASVDAVVTDPPYGLAFKGEAWDGGQLGTPAGFQAFTEVWAGEVRRVLRPGGHLVCFGATRTFHRLASGVEEAGLEVRDLLLWLHGAGVPKSQRYPGGIGTALKPAYEPILLARAPLGRGLSVGANRARYGTGGLNIDACRIQATSSENGYWPSQLLLSHEADCAETCDGGCGVPALDAAGPQGVAGGLSRLFYVAKTSLTEREAGCEHLPTGRQSIFNGRQLARARANSHPTVKPLDLMRWLVRLVTPPRGLVLDPFAGSGSTGCAAVLEQRQFLGIEKDRRYLPIARARLAHWTTLAAKSGRRLT